MMAAKVVAAVFLRCWKLGPGRLLFPLSAMYRKDYYIHGVASRKAARGGSYKDRLICLQLRRKSAKRASERCRTR
jgi:hypothetical protein